MRTLLRIIVYITLATLLFAAAIAISVPVDAWIGRDRIAALANTTFPNAGAVPVAAYVAEPPGVGPHPAVIMIHEFWGLQSSILGKADALAREGYVVVAPDTYRGSVTSWLPRAIYLSLTTPTERVNVDLDAVFAWLAGRPDVDPNRIIVMGFCYGGGKALRYSLHNRNVAGTGIFYGSLITDPAVLQDLPGPVLGIFGSEDQNPSPDAVREFEIALNAASVPYEITIYEGEGHAFVKDVESIRQGGAQGAAWMQFLAFLERF
jgi:carboxymethylenebutenolidase